MIRRFLAPLLAAVAAVVVCSPGAALADTTGRIVQVTTDNGTLHVLFTASGLSSATTIDPASVKVTIDHTTVPSTAALVGQQTTKVDRSAMLVIDTSGSMVGTGIAGAKSAAGAFLKAVPADVKVGLVTFSDRPTLNIAPTTDRSAVQRAIIGLRAHGETALYDAVGLALRTLGGSGLRNVVLLTDGADTRSKTKLSQLIPQIQASKVTIDAVGFRTTDAQSVPLRSIALSAKGQVISATEAGSLADAFATAARDISHQLVISVAVPTQFSNGSHTIAVQATAGSATLTDSVFAPIGAATKATKAPATDYGPKPLKAPNVVSTPVLYAGLAALFLALLVALAIAITAISRRERSSGVRRRLSIYTLTGRPVEESREEASTVLGESAVARSAVELAGRVVARRDFEGVLAAKLEAGGIPMRPAEWLILHVGIAVLGGVVLLLISGGGLLATFLGFMGGLLGPWLYLSIKEGRRAAAFMERMPDTLQLMAGGLRAGYSLPQSIDAVVQEGSEPISTEFHRALVETRLGVTIEDALEGVGTRMASVDFQWVVMAIRIQREVGGNLAEVLTTVAATLRERERLRRQVRVLSAEGRLSAWILGGLPVLFFVYLLLVRHSYIQALWKDSIGVVMLIFMIVDLIVGAFWLRKVIQVEV
ncbi:MAG TPA: type II secretion system F family protein [Mycobacteriales bacterium]|nr:type II secretion system F family protein [Mycobacteriales bacterium]